jgi:hypothetical protein
MIKEDSRAMACSMVILILIDIAKHIVPSRYPSDPVIAPVLALYHVPNTNHCTAESRCCHWGIQYTTESQPTLGRQGFRYVTF